MRDEGRDSWRELAGLIPTEPPLPFAGERLSTLAEPVRRYFLAAITEGTPLAPAVKIRMRGSIKLGRWLPFRAEQLLAPRIGTVWRARVAGVIRGSDRYVAGAGAMDWRLFGRVPVMHASGTDVSRSAAGRVAGESVWVPSATPDLSWRAVDDDRVAVDVEIGPHTTSVEHRLDGAGRVLSSRFERWGDPDRTGSFGSYPFGLHATDWRTFGGITIPAAGRVGWHAGTERWEEGEFFRFEILDYELVNAPPSSPTMP